METIRITTSQNIDIDYEVAGLGERILARLLDYAIFFVLYILLSIIIVSIAISGNEGILLLALGFFLIYAFYDLVCEFLMNGQSIGKKVMKIRVISLDGAKPRFSQFILRWLFRIVDFTLSAELCALICVAVTENKQRLGDIVAGTILIRTVPRVKIGNIAFRPGEEDYQPIYTSVTLLSDKDIELIHEVITTYYTSNNPNLVYAMATKVKEHLGITQLEGMHELAFLQTVIKDYNFLTSQIPG